MKRATHARERGMILINVLVIVMLASLVLTIILIGADSDAERNQQLRDAAQARAIARGAELSAIAALRRDLVGGGQGDMLSEPWAKIGDTNARIDGGRFTFAVNDAQARFNLNSLRDDDPTRRATLAAIFAATGIPADAVDGLVGLLKQGGPIRNLGDLTQLGITPAQLERLTRFCTILPEPTNVNFNTAPQELLAVMLGNATTAARIASLRAGPQGLTQADLLAQGLVLPPGSATTSDYYWAQSRVTIGGTAQQLTSLIHRSYTSSKPRVVAIRRWRGRGPLQAPLLP